MIDKANSSSSNVNNNFLYIKIDPYWEQFTPVPSEVYYILAPIYVFIGVFGFVGNVIVLGLYIK